MRKLVMHEVNEGENEFVKVKLGEMTVIVAGQSPKSEFYTNDDKHMPFLQGSRTFGGLYPFYDVYTKNITKLAKKNDI